MIEGPARSSIDLKARVYYEHPLPWTLEHDHFRDADGWAVLSVDGERGRPRPQDLWPATMARSLRLGARDSPLRT